MAEKRPLILISNDDGLSANGIKALTEEMQEIGEVFIVAPDGPRSAQSSALTTTIPLRANLIKQEEGLTIYSCNGTPADCVKLAIEQLVPRKPDLVVSGINHGTNSSINVIYSGTMGATLEGCLSGIPSIGFSLYSYDVNAHLENSKRCAKFFAKKVLEKGLPHFTCLNINIPNTEHIKGIKITQQAEGTWTDSFVKKQDPRGRDYYWMTGDFVNSELNNKETDEYALAEGYISVCPTKIDMTDYNFIDKLKTWNDGNFME